MRIHYSTCKRESDWNTWTTISFWYLCLHMEVQSKNRDHRNWKLRVLTSLVPDVFWNARLLKTPNFEWEAICKSVNTKSKTTRISGMSFWIISGLWSVYIRRFLWKDTHYCINTSIKNCFGRTILLSRYQWILHPWGNFKIS